MGASLREQLLKAGFKLEPKPPKERGMHRGQGKPQGGEIDLAKAYALRVRTEKAQVQANKQAKARENARRKRQNDALEALLKDQALNDPQAEIARHFMDGGRITRIYVTQQQRFGLAEGRLGIVKLRRRYLLVDGTIGERAAAIKPDAVMDLSGEVEAP